MKLQTEDEYKEQLAKLCKYSQDAIVVRLSALHIISKIFSDMEKDNNDTSN